VLWFVGIDRARMRKKALAASALPLRRLQDLAYVGRAFSKQCPAASWVDIAGKLTPAVSSTLAARLDNEWIPDGSTVCLGFSILRHGRRRAALRQCDLSDVWSTARLARRTRSLAG
jgi:hypothetical protein